MKNKHKNTLGRKIAFLTVIALAIIFIFPLLIMFTTSLKNTADAFDPNSSFFPKSINIDNYREVFRTIPFFKYLGNTLWITMLNVLGTVVVTPMLAYSLSKVKWAGRDIVFAIITATMMIPSTVTMLPLYKMWVKIGLVGTYWPLIIPAFLGHPLYIILLRQFMLTIPDELLEAAKLDGCGAWSRYSKIVLPLAKPGIFTVVIFTFMYTFSDFLGPLLYANKVGLKTLSIGLYSFMNEHTINWTALMAAATLYMIPILIIFIVGQKQFVEGIATSGLKG